MLNKVTKICRPIFRQSAYSFGGSHGAPVKIQIDKQATWIKFNTTRRLACVDGVQDTHVPLPELLDVDPIPHLRNAPWYDLDAFFYGEIFFHSLDHEPNSTTLQGYTLADEPNQSKFDMIVPGLYTFGTILALIMLRQYSDPYNSKPTAEIVLEADYLQSLVDKKLSEKANRIKQLQAEIQQRWS